MLLNRFWDTNDPGNPEGKSFAMKRNESIHFLDPLLALTLSQVSKLKMKDFHSSSNFWIDIHGDSLLAGKMVIQTPTIPKIQESELKFS